MLDQSDGFAFSVAQTFPSHLASFAGESWLRPLDQRRNAENRVAVTSRQEKNTPTQTVTLILRRVYPPRSSAHSILAAAAHFGPALA